MMDGLYIYLMVYLIVQVWLIVKYFKSRVSGNLKFAMIALTIFIMPLSLLIYLFNRNTYKSS